MLLRFFLYGFCADIRDIIVPLIGNDGFGIIIQLFLAVNDMLLDLLCIRPRKLQLLHDFFVTLKDFDRIPAQIAAVGNDMFDRFFNMRDRMFYASFKDMRSLTDHRIPCGGDHCICDSIDSVRLQCAHFKDGAAKLFRKLCGIDDIPVLCNDIHHVNGNNRRDTEFQQLGGQIKISLNVRSVHDVQDRIGLLVHQILTGNDFLQCIR